MPILTTAAITDLVFPNLKSYFIKRVIDKQLSKFDDKQEFALRRVINETLDEYAAKFPVESTRTTFPFYQSQRIMNELLSFRVMHRDDYQIEQLTTAFEAEPNVIPPSSQNVEDLFAIFMEKVNADNNLKKLEIKETFQEEIFIISRKIDGVKQYIENMFAGFDADLQLQWRDRVDTYVSTLQAFKPQTALNLLDALLKSLNAGSTKPTATFTASIEYQRGICYKLLLNKNESCKAFIKAYQLNAQNSNYEQQAALAYHKIGEHSSAIDLANAIIAKDQFSAIGWAVRLLNIPKDELDGALAKVPGIVKTDLAFQMAIYNNFSSENKQEQLGILYDRGIVPSFADYVPKPITVNNISEHSFWLSVMINAYFNDFFFEFQNVHDKSKEELVKALNDLLKRYFEAIAGTELPQPDLSLHFILALTNYLLTGEASYAQSMADWFKKLKTKPIQFLLITANILQNAGEVESAIELIENSGDKGAEVLMLKAYCYLKSHQTEKYATSVKEVTQALSEVPHDILYGYVNHMIDLKTLGLAGELSVTDFLDGKEFETQADKALVQNIGEALLNGSSSEIVTGLLNLSDGTDDPRAQGLIATTLHLSGEHEQALSVFRKFIDKSEESRDLYHYIHALHETKKNNKELLELLEFWRLNCWFDPWFTRTEFQMNRELANWSKCVEISTYYLSNEPDDEDVLMNHALALHEEGSGESVKKLGALVTKLRDFDYRAPQHARIAANLLIKHKYFTEAIDLLYRYAVDNSNKLLRTAYFMAFTEIKPGEEQLWPIKEYDTTEAGHFVKYKLNGKIKFVELNEANLKNPFNKEFIGCGKGGGFNRKRPMSDDEDFITIERIMNKYLSLHDEILEEVQDDPYSGIPMQSFTIDPDNIVDSMHEVLQKMMGESGSRERDRVKEELAEYYNYQRSFSDVIVRVYKENYLAGYFDLARNNRGINMLPITNFIGTSPAKTYIIDLSSLPILYQMYLNHGTIFPEKFIISRYIVDSIKKQLSEARNDKGEHLSLTVTLEEVRPSVVPENAQEGNIKYLTGLLQWISENCVEEITERVLDFTRQTDIDEGRKQFLKYFLNTSLLLEEKSEIKLITDDVLYYNLGVSPQRIVSSEYFVKQVLAADAPELNEFLVNNYRGYSVSLEQMNQEYVKKAAGQPDLYSHCLENISLLNNPAYARIAIEHIKWLVLNSVINQPQLELEITEVFVNLLKGINMPGLQENFKTLVAEHFKLLGTKKDMVLGCLTAAFDIVDS